MIRTTLTLLASVLLAGTALAAPVLRGEIVVADPIVTVGDMFDDAGALAETPLFRAPKPGTSGLVPLKDIEAAARRAGLAEFDAAGLLASRVSRSASVVDADLLSDLIAADLRHRGILTDGMSADTMFASPVQPLNAEAVAEPVHVVSLRYLPGNGAFTARFSIAGIEQPLELTGTIELMIEAPHLVGSHTSGSVLSVADIEMRPVPLRFAEATGIAPLDQLIGMALIRQSRDGMMLKPADVTTPLLVGKNDLVTIYFRRGPLTLTVKGQAITGAAQGAPLQVLNLMSKRVISATAVAAGAVEVSTQPLTLAGL
jgi:flagellar basal body P-ring formation protein FlgA